MSLLDYFGTAADRVAFALSPEWGNKRAAHRMARGMLDHNAQRIKDAGFKRRSNSRLRPRSFKQAESDDKRDDRYVTEDRSINSLLEDQQAELQFRAVGLYGENSIAHGIVESRVTYEIGAGLKIKPTVKQSRFVSADQAKQINAVLAETIRCWSLHGVDKSRTMSFGAAQRLMVREFANYGECFMLLGDAEFAGQGNNAGPVPTAIEFISPIRVDTPYEYLNDPAVRMGVRYRKKQVVGYYVRKNTPNDDKEPATADWTYYPRFDKAGIPRMVHLFETMFAGQARGIPYLCSAMHKILDFDDYQEAEIIAKQVEACFGLIFKIKKQDNATSLYDVANAAATAGSQGTDDLMEEISPAFIQRIGEDDEVKPVDPSRPGSSYAPFLEGSMRMIASATNIPYEIIAKNFFRTTYSSGKLAMLDGKMGFTMRRSATIDGALIPIYTRVLSDRVFADEADGTIPVEDWVRDQDAYTSHKYQAKQMGEIDNAKEMNAFKTGRAEGIVNKADYHDENGNDWEAHEDQAYEERLLEVNNRLALEKYEMDQRKNMGLPALQDPNAESDASKPKPKPEETAA